MKSKIIVIFLICILSVQQHCFSEAKKFLVFGGKTGWIGQKITKYLTEQDHLVFTAESRMENRNDVDQEIQRIAPDYIINCAGVTGTPNVDWCEDNKLQTIRTNIIGTLNLVDLAALHQIHITNFSTGCIFEYDEKHPMGSGVGFKEEDEPNFDGSFYSKTKGLLEKLLSYYPNLLNLRLRMPISADLHHKNFITKISRYQKVINIPNSMTILDDLLPIAIDMTLKNVKGVYNFVNTETLSHNEILDLYKYYIDPSFTYQNFTVEEQDKILKARRSNNELNTEKLQQLYPNLPSAKDSLHKVFQKMKNDLDKKQQTK
ncbi:MAG: sugar nucleotide-binding protein [Rhabdochlamydiaceae bacterium]|nr:sugar nucleotide-binding protein [Rhabdochlamydiaceae bacterium]